MFRVVCSRWADGTTDDQVARVHEMLASLPRHDAYQPVLDCVRSLATDRVALQFEFDA